MAEYLIQDTTLTEIADAIRSKTGSTDSIAIKDMASKINNMETFIDYENTYVTSISKREYSKLDKFRSISFPNVTKIGEYAFFNGATTENQSNGYNLITASFPLVKSIGGHAFMYNQNLTNIFIPVCTGIGQGAFFHCKSLISIDAPELQNADSNICTGCDNLLYVNIPKATIIFSWAFSECTSLKSINIPKVYIINTGSFKGCSSLETINLSGFKDNGYICNDSFRGCTALKSVIFSNVAIVIGLENTSAFADTTIANGTGYIYVPDSLVNSYKTAENWSVYASQIKPLSEYVEE